VAAAGANQLAQLSPYKHCAASARRNNFPNSSASTFATKLCLQTERDYRWRIDAHSSMIHFAAISSNVLLN
jgi:hypothetical protein